MTRRNNQHTICFQTLSYISPTSTDNAEIPAVRNTGLTLENDAIGSNIIKMQLTDC